jgi:hypothetical protein
MKLYLFLLVTGSIASLLVSALVFRSTRARGILRFIRNAGWAYVGAVVLLAAYHVYSEGF